MSHFWMVRAGEGGYLTTDFERLGCVAIGWPEVGDLSSVSSLEQTKERVAAAYPNWRRGTQISSASTLFKLRSVMRQRDRVVSYDPVRREYLLGAVSSDYEYSPAAIPDHPHRRLVSWDKRISRDSLSPGARNTLGSTLTIFEPGKDVLRELEGRIASPAAEPAPAQAGGTAVDDLDSLRQDLIGRAHEFIKDRILQLDPDEMEHLVAALLRAMGYKARVTTKGPDRGRDVIASPDGLGFRQPRVFAEVKHRAKEPAGPDKLRSFLGGLRDGDCGLYVSVGGFTREAHYEAERAKHPVTLLDLDQLAELIVEHYESFDSDGRALISLARVYWPTA